MGAPSTITGRLLSYEEADSAQSIEDNGIPIIFVGGGHWVGSVGSTDGMWAVYSDGSSFVPYGSYSDTGNFGVRPVIEIPTSELQ